MHEASIALSIIKKAEEHCLGAGYGKITAVKIKIGRASGVMPGALCFAFEALKPSTLAEGALLEIDEIPVAGLCRACGDDFTSGEAYVFFCPSCESPEIEIRSGREMDITELEVS